SPNPFGESPKGLILVFCSSVLSPERKDQISGEKEQSACHRAVPRSSTMSPNDPKHDDAEGYSKTAMKPTKEGFEELEDSKGFNSKNLDLGLMDSSLLACFEI
ncbi:hypothetical protein MTR67_018007, partial [Solanum verrucosum]